MTFLSILNKLATEEREINLTELAATYNLKISLDDLFELCRRFLKTNPTFKVVEFDGVLLLTELQYF